MELPDLKALKRLADTCRKAGISHFKSDKFEFTLTDTPPLSEYKKAKASGDTNAADTSFKTDTLTEEELMYWSVGIPSEVTESTNE